MKRSLSLAAIRAKKDPWDIVVIGGGATGLGIAVDAATRNFSVLLLEQYDFAKGTSSRSTKLIHGGVRYLQQGDVSLVFEALRERGILRQNAPHLIHNLSFVIPTYDWWGGPFYTIGLKVYDLMAGKLGLGPSEHLSREEVISVIPTVEQKGLRGGVIYHDGQFDDARMAISLAQTATDYGGTVINYFKVTGLIKESGIICGVSAEDNASGEQFEIKAKAVVNATGVFSNSILKMDQPNSKDLIKPSQGVHLIVDKKFLPGKHAILIPQTSDGRVLFAVPWYDRVILGTTDTVMEKPVLEPEATEKEINFILENASQYLTEKPTRKDVKSVFAGLRPLAAPEEGGVPTKEISRHHKVLISTTGLVTITGGKWTTYRKMAEDTVDKAILVGGLDEVPCLSEKILIHGYTKKVDYKDPMHVYGTDSLHLQEIEQSKKKYAGFLSESLRIKKSQVVWAVREEMAQTLEDVLARRTRALFLDAREAIRIAEETAKIMAEILKRDESWVQKELKVFYELAKKYLTQP